MVGGVRKSSEADDISELLPVDQAAFDLAMDGLKVIAQASPEDKLLIMCGLQNKGTKAAIFVDKPFYDQNCIRKSQESFSTQTGADVKVKNLQDI